MQKIIKLSTKGCTDIIDITREVQEILNKSKVKIGIINVFCRHTTSSITIMEHEPGLTKDMKDIFNLIVPEKFPYYHNKLNDDDNGCSHFKASLLGESVTIPFDKGNLLLGIWQKIVLVDFDTHPRDREIVVSIIKDN